MATLGIRNSLKVVRSAPPGLYLDGEELGEILLPNRYIVPGTVPGSVLEVFVHRDSEDRLVATTEVPRAMVGECASFRVVSVSPQLGAFLDWGLAKDLLLPNREQEGQVREGQRVVACVTIDPRSGRIIATMRLRDHLHREEALYPDGQAVRLLIAGRTPLGFNAVVNGKHLGLLFSSECPADLEIGSEVGGFVRAVRPDGKIDLTLNASGYQRVAPLGQTILEVLKNAGGGLPVDDSSSPEIIRQAFGCSKKAFKQALGALYREQKITFAPPGIQLVEKGRR